MEGANSWPRLPNTGMEEWFRRIEEDTACTIKNSATEKSSEICNGCIFRRVDY